MEKQTRSPLLPDTLTPEALGQWFRDNAKETFKDEKKLFFEEDELNAMARQSSGHGAEIGQLKGIMAQVKNAVEKGLAGDTPLIIEIHPTSGTSALDKARAENDQLIKAGYRKEEQTIYSIPDAENEQMAFFYATGEEVADRRRAMSAKEKHDYVGLFLLERNKSDRELLLGNGE